jgi:tRNA-specific 2-thiouridylase
MKRKTVFVGLSGGVDSAVSAALLKKEGYEVVGVFIKTWHPDFLECNEEEERIDAMRVAAFLDIPFLTFDFEDVYKKEVADYMIREYKAGRTPNPDVMCNKEVKFGAFLNKAISMGADFVATGHYAENIFSQSLPVRQAGLGPSLRSATPSKKHFLLRKGQDPSKDQSYFLWILRQEQLNKILFPVGNLKKTEVRTLARKFKLPVAEKKDSQGICFLGAVDLKEFLKHYIKEKKGKVLNEKGEEIGVHDGVVFHTLGERHGFTITKKSPKDGPYYIVAKDLKKNVLTVSQNKEKNNSNMGADYRIENTNWISEVPKEKKKYTAQIRYHGGFLSCQIKVFSKNEAEIIFEKPILVASGQSIVVYDGDVCLGGGVVV